MDIDLKKHDSTSARLGLGARRAGVVINKYTALISVVLYVVAMLFIGNSVKKVMELEVKATNKMKQKIVHDTLRVVENKIVNDCDTVYIIDGKRFKSAN